MRRVESAIKIHNAEARASESSFSKVFMELSPEFASRLRQLHPSLSETDIKMLSLIAIGLQGKRIASTLGIRVESVKQARWRIRKKLSPRSRRDYRGLSRPLQSLSLARVSTPQELSLGRDRPLQPLATAMPPKHHDSIIQDPRSRALTMSGQEALQKFRSLKWWIAEGGKCPDIARQWAGRRSAGDEEHGGERGYSLAAACESEMLGGGGFHAHAVDVGGEV